MSRWWLWFQELINIRIDYSQRKQSCDLHVAAFSSITEKVNLAFKRLFDGKFYQERGKVIAKNSSLQFSVSIAVNISVSCQF